MQPRCTLLTTEATCAPLTERQTKRCDVRTQCQTFQHTTQAQRLLSDTRPKRDRYRIGDSSPKLTDVMARTQSRDTDTALTRTDTVPPPLDRYRAGLLALVAAGRAHATTVEA